MDMNDYLETKTNFFSRFVNKFKTIFKKKESNEYIEKESKFKNLVEDEMLSETEKQLGEHVAVLCDEALEIATRRLVLVNKIKKISDDMIEVEVFSRLTKDEASKLKNLLDSFVSLTKERNVLMNQIMAFNKTLSKMEDMKDSAVVEMKDIKDAEEKQKIFRYDLSQLRGEKADLEYECVNFENSLIFINRFVIFLAFALGFSAMFIVFSYYQNDTDIFFPCAILSILVIIISAIIYMFRKRMKYELTMNIKKQQKAVELINKKNAVFAHYTNYLSHEYSKFDVRNSKMLQNNIKDWDNYKHLTNRVDNIRKIMYETEKEIGKFVRHHGMKDIKTNVENFAKNINIDDKIKYHKDLLKSLKTEEDSLEKLDKKHEGIWDLLITLSKTDNSYNKISDKIIDSYLKEVDEMFISQQKRKIDIDDPVFDKYEDDEFEEEFDNGRI